jgi:hypothetical protein
MYEDNLDETYNINEEPNKIFLYQKALNLNKSTLQVKNVPKLPNARTFIHYNYQ